MNVEGMLPFENQVADYVASTGNHVLYRVTPAFVDTELVARGVEMEAYSVEDQGRGVCFHVYCYNVQPGVGDRLCHRRELGGIMELWKNFDRLVVFDTETTGIEFGRDRIIEIGAVALENGAERGNFNALVRLPAGQMLPTFITELTGITDEQLDREGRG